MLPMYTIYRCKSKKDDTRKGYIHFADTDKVTSCGKSIDNNWYILTTDHRSTATCPKCNKLHNTKPNAIQLLKIKIKKINPEFTDEQVNIKFDEMFSNIEKLLNTNI